MSKSREYQALALLGPGTDPESWAVRMALASLIVNQELQSSLGEAMELLPSGALAPLYKLRLERQAMNALPMNCGITITITGDAKTGTLTIGGHPTPMETEALKKMKARYNETLAAMDKAMATGADYVRCRACANTGAPLMRNKSWIALDDTCQPLNGPDDMLCPCGKLREPYDCQTDEWVKV
jgi:hypothetical protein